MVEQGNGPYAVEKMHPVFVLVNPEKGYDVK